jgi:transcriptional regulator of acetoin/glycerol metabolism
VSDLDFGRRAASAGATTAARPGAITAPAESGESGRSFYKRISDQERNEIVAAVERAQGNIAHAARSLGINRSTLYYRMRKHNLEHLLPTRDDTSGSDPQPA